MKFCEIKNYKMWPLAAKKKLETLEEWVNIIARMFDACYILTYLYKNLATWKLGGNALTWWLGQESLHILKD